MRPQTKNIFPDFFGLESSETEHEKVHKNVQHYRDLYKTFDEYLKPYPEFEQLAHEDLTPTLQKHFDPQWDVRKVLIDKQGNFGSIAIC